MTTSLPVIPPVRSFEPGDGNVFTLTGHARIHALDTALLPEADLLI